MVCRGPVLCVPWTCMVLFGCADFVRAAESVLPEGNSPAAIVSRHFPDRVHEFVWRNWNAVAPAKLAKILGARVEEVTALAESMGLPPAGAIPPEMKTRGYITVIRRNWHLLPYSQLLELVEMTPERLAFALREDDFLWVKLGRLKPKCEPLRYQPPDEAARRRAAEIRRVVERDFGQEIRRPAEPRFDFVRQLSSADFRSLGDFGSLGTSSKHGQDEPVSFRLVYSYLAVYGDPLSDPSLDPYPDGFLQRLAAVGVNGVWLHVVLRDLAPGGTAFPKFGAECEPRLANLRVLVQRAKRHGVGVYLYMNEPRAMPASFFKNRPDMAGVREEEFTALCTSHPAVRQWMADALTYVFRQVPDLAGVYAITASENLTNCASHGDWRSCQRCKGRSDADILAEVIGVIEAGVHRGNPKANVVVSDWGWRGHGDATDLIPRLPKSLWLMSVSEWDKPIERGGIATKVGEYAISAVGPGPRAVRHWAAARQAGMKTAAEIQFNNTCEIASIPYLSVMDLVAEHLQNLAPAQLDGMLIGWTMGGHPSPNFQLAQRLNQTPVPNVDAVLDALARERFGAEGAAHGRKAWTLLSDAYRQYPFHISVVYTSPVQIGPANPLYASKTGYSATMWGIPYDDLNGWRGPYPSDVFARQFEKMAEGWRTGVAELQRAVEKTPPGGRSEAETDLRFAQAAGIHFQSVANQARFVIARDALAGSSGTRSPDERRRLRAEIQRSLESEIVLARQLYTLVWTDSRIGFEPSCQYFYLPLDLVEKVVNCRWLSGQLEDGDSKAPYPPGPVIRGVRWAPPEKIVRMAKGSDNWPLTWADDDLLYTAYGDGNGFEPFVDVKLGLGLAKVGGGPERFHGVNLRSAGVENRGQGAKGKKASGMLMVGGRLYMLLRNAANAELVWSDDRGQTWQRAAWRFEQSFGCPTFLNFGKNYAGARDNYVYVYSHDSDSAYRASDQTVFARVPKDRVTDRAAYEFFVKTDDHGQPAWTREIARRGAVLTNPGLCYRTSVSYNAALKRYLLCQILFGEEPRFVGGFGIYDAPEPWGPWTTVYFTPRWDVGPGETCSIPTKWMSADGKQFYLVFSGDDCFSVRRAETVRKEDSQ